VHESYNLHHRINKSIPELAVLFSHLHLKQKTSLTNCSKKVVWQQINTTFKKTGSKTKYKRNGCRAFIKGTKGVTEFKTGTNLLFDLVSIRTPNFLAKIKYN